MAIQAWYLKKTPAFMVPVQIAIKQLILKLTNVVSVEKMMSDFLTTYGKGIAYKRKLERCLV